MCRWKARGLLLQVSVIYYCLPCVREPAGRGLWPTLTIPVHNDPDATVTLGHIDNKHPGETSGLSGAHVTAQLLEIFSQNHFYG